MKLKIKVTKEVLEATKLCGTDRWKLSESEDFSKSGNCAITYACRKLFPGCITTQCFIVFNSHCITLPEIAAKFITNFDRATVTQRVNMKPIEFEVELPEQLLNEISIDEITEILKTSTTLEIV